MPVLNELLPKTAIRPYAEFRFRYEYFGNTINGNVLVQVLNDAEQQETEARLTLPLADLGFTQAETNAVRDLLRTKLQALAQDNNLTVYQED